MRIISGKNRGRHIVAPSNLPVRPTMDMGKESLFNILNNYFYLDNIHVLDLFSGTGNITYEFASRSALSVIAVDENILCTKFIQKTIEQLKYDNVTVVRQDAFAFLKSCHKKFNVIFADPPYDMPNIELLPDLVFDNNLLLPDGWFVLEHSGIHDFSQHTKFYEHRKYGKLHFSFFVDIQEDNQDDK